jgi:hypothetical protein
LGKLPIWFLGGVRSWDAIKAYLRGIKMREPDLGLIVIDYCQLLSAPALSANMDETLTRLEFSVE